MALSMEEQRILDAMELKLADDDPKLASRLAAFGQPRLPAMFGSRRVRAIAILVSMALATIVAVLVYSMRPAPAGTPRQTPAPQRSQVIARPSEPSGLSSGAPAVSRPTFPSAF